MKLFTCSSFLALLLVTNGCIFSRPKNGPPVVKEVADLLETVTNGTPYDRIPWVSGALPNDFQHVSAGYVFLYVAENPLDDKYVTLYRQVPPGILMHVTERDYQLVPPVEETRGDNYQGGLTVFFDSEKKYKGYYAWSAFGAFKDPPVRLAREKRQFIEAGLVSESKYTLSHIALENKGLHPRIHSLPLDKSAAP